MHSAPSLLSGPYGEEAARPAEHAAAAEFAPIQLLLEEQKHRHQNLGLPEVLSLEHKVLQA